MSREQEARRAVYLRWFEALHARDLSQLDALAEEWIADSFILHDPSFAGLPPGRVGVKELAGRLVETNSHLAITLDDFFGDGDKTAARFTVQRTNALTGQATRFVVLALDDWAGNQLVEEWQLAGPAEELA